MGYIKRRKTRKKKEILLLIVRYKRTIKKYYVLDSVNLYFFPEENNRIQLENCLLYLTESVT